MPEKIAAVVGGKALVPISLILTMLGGGGFVTNQALTTQHNTKILERLDDDFDRHINRVETNNLQFQRDTRDLLNNIQKRLSRIEGRLDTK